MVWGISNAVCRGNNAYGVTSLQVKNKSDSSGFPITALREINVLLSLQHENIISVKEMVVDDDHEEVNFNKRFHYQY